MPKPAVLAHRNLTFGHNRRQKPMRICCPGGEIYLTRGFRGAVQVEVVSFDSKAVVVNIPAEEQDQHEA